MHLLHGHLPYLQVHNGLRDLVLHQALLVRWEGL